MTYRIIMVSVALGTMKKVYHSEKNAIFDPPQPRPHVALCHLFSRPHSYSHYKKLKIVKMKIGSIKF